MEPIHILGLIAAYFSLLIGVSFITSSKNSTNEDFFMGSKQSPWYVVAFGMIGASLSGVTFISVPGWVNSSGMSYMQMVLGYFIGYLFISLVLMPIYYKLNLTSIYTYLEGRFGRSSYKTGSSFFILSRVIGASFRLFLVANVFQLVIFDSMGVPFWLTVTVTILLIWLYTFRSGIKTIVWTDTLQTLFMLLSLGLTFWFVSQELGIACMGDLEAFLSSTDMGQIFFFDNPKEDTYFWKKFLAGIFLAIVMTGLDQDMMQKNLSCKNLEEAQTNMFSFSIVLVFVNFVFLALGVLLYSYAQMNGIDAVGDQLFPAIALGGNFGFVVGALFIIGLIAAAYSSADSALASLTTAFCVDILEIEKKDSKKQSSIRKKVHIGFSLLLLVVIVGFKYIVSESVVSDVFSAAGYTYGPLLGMYAMGIFTKIQIKDKYMPIVAILAPFVTFGVKYMAKEIWDWEIGFELLIINGLLTFIGMLLIRKK